jgi:hypothetical protein
LQGLTDTDDDATAAEKSAALVTVASGCVIERAEPWRRRRLQRLNDTDDEATAAKERVRGVSHGRVRLHSADVAKSVKVAVAARGALRRRLTKMITTGELQLTHAHVCHWW